MQDALCNALQRFLNSLSDFGRFWPVRWDNTDVSGLLLRGLPAITAAFGAFGALHPTSAPKIAKSDRLLSGD